MKRQLYGTSHPSLPIEIEAMNSMMGVMPRSGFEKLLGARTTWEISW